MLTTIRFYKITEEPQEGWYADIPNHSLAENQMVEGSDTFLELVDKDLNGKGEVFITVSDEPQPMAIAKLSIMSHDEFGATYILSDYLAERYDADGFKLWICNVIHDTFGEHPNYIYIVKIEC